MAERDDDVPAQDEATSAIRWQAICVNQDHPGGVWRGPRQTTKKKAEEDGAEHEKLGLPAHETQIVRT